SGSLNAFLNSKDAQQRQVGQVLVRLEYENLMTALHLALDAQVSILELYNTLSSYLDAVKDLRPGLALGDAVVARLQAYRQGVLSGPLGGELLSVVNDMHRGQFDLKQYATAEASCQEMLRLLNAQATLDGGTREKVKAGILHNWGWVVREQR